jgi:hypothetical protein
MVFFGGFFLGSVKHSSMLIRQNQRFYKDEVFTRADRRVEGLVAEWVGGGMGVWVGGG